ncbi:hypothetical protein E2C01_008342 [Portunus trituberculatus]|uniref:Uncharacterized protein n=1 Tax=Portunus trituberculatus TaxID=210409 RepID=A0A5B7D0J7_PORTR|nr:hypothetical protein [Portunus trituberculatus]
MGRNVDLSSKTVQLRHVLRGLPKVFLQKPREDCKVRECSVSFNITNITTTITTTIITITSTHLLGEWRGGSTHREVGRACEGLPECGRGWAFSAGRPRQLRGEALQVVTETRQPSLDRKFVHEAYAPVPYASPVTHHSNPQVNHTHLRKDDVATVVIHQRDEVPVTRAVDVRHLIRMTLVSIQELRHIPKVVLAGHQAVFVVVQVADVETT